MMLAMASPDVRYARSGGVAVAYQVVGDAAETVMYAPHLTNIYLLWKGRHPARFLQRVAESVRLIIFNPRGTGLSDRPRNVTLEARMDDVTAVLDAEQLERATLFGVAESANVCALYAATYPERCKRLVLFSPYARLTRSETFPEGISEEEALTMIKATREQWGERPFLRGLAAAVDPRLLENEEDFDWFVWMQRLGASPAAAADFMRMAIETDLTDILGSIRVPTLVLHRESSAEAARFVASRIPDAVATGLGGVGAGPYDDAAADALLAFVQGKAAVEVPDTILTTLLFTDIVGSTDMAVELGDRRWREKLEEHHTTVRRTLDLPRPRGGHRRRRVLLPLRRSRPCDRVRPRDHRGGPGGRTSDTRRHPHGRVRTARGQGGGPRCPCRRAHLGSATSGEVLVSQTVRDLVAGSDFVFQERGVHELKGIPGRWHLYAATA